MNILKILTDTPQPLQGHYDHLSGTCNGPTAASEHVSITGFYDRVMHGDSWL